MEAPGGLRSKGVDAGELQPLDEAAFMAYLRQILEGIDEEPAANACRTCRGSGICWMCRGNGRLLVLDQGSVQCRVCIGDGACIRCGGTGEQRRG